MTVFTKETLNPDHKRGSDSLMEKGHNIFSKYPYFGWENESVTARIYPDGSRGAVGLPTCADAKQRPTAPPPSGHAYAQIPRLRAMPLPGGKQRPTAPPP